ncbi:hypothetical protein PRV_01880 [Mycoplasma parvum str. Indiana]|uniref:Uncharacterized protein n=1 Tax=Mycoplasma parvum str. Indiana TaxID=1403316 RepID=U5NCG3_9MOLU|nr:hypothetical protein PRV_01880 [Mycoplasma parvum str. Indiana]
MIIIVNKHINVAMKSTTINITNFFCFGVKGTFFFDSSEFINPHQKRNSQIFINNC